MTRDEFLTQFEKHLLVGEPKRSELIAEITHHLTDDPTSQTSDPVALAKKLNRTHLGIFSSWSRLVWLALIMAALFETAYLILIYGETRTKTVWPFAFATVIGFIISYLPIVAMIIAGHAISSMHHRWRLTGKWVLLISALLIAFELSQYFSGQSLFIPERSALVQSFMLIGESFAIVIMITLFVVWLSIGHRTFIPRYRILDLIITFAILAVGTDIALVTVTDILTGFLRNTSTTNVQLWVVGHQWTAALFGGVLGTLIEAYRLRWQSRHFQNAQ